MGWQAAFVELTGDGALDRERVLTSALAALGRDFSAYRAGWYTRLYDALQPSMDELDRHQPHLRALLRSDVPATVSFVVTKLKTLSSADCLDTAAAVPALAPAVLAKAKGTALAALRLVAAAAKGENTRRDDAVRVAALALQHPHADVQRAAAALLAQLDAQHAVLANADQLEPSVQQALGLSASADPMATRFSVAASPSATMPPRVAANDLLDRTAALLEDASDVLELELVLDGLARLDEPLALQPLVKRGASISHRGPREGVMSGWLRGQLARLVLIADGQETPPLATRRHPVDFLTARIDEVSRTLSGAHRPQELLAVPDDAAGWLTPSTFVDRLLRANSVRHHDLIAALLRLDPADREAALSRVGAATHLPPGLLAVVRYALGGSAPAAQRRTFGRRTPKLTDTSWWIAASRTRTPLEPDEWLASQGMQGAGRSSPIDSRVQFRGHPYTWRDHQREHHTTAWKWTVVDPHAGPVNADEPTSIGTHAEAFMYGQGFEDFTGWAASIYPHDAEHFLSGQIDAVLYAAAYTEVNHDAVLVLDALGRHPGRLGPLAWACLAAGLTASKADQRARVVDAVHGLHAQGRLDAGGLAEGLSNLVGPATLPRWAGSLRDLAAIDAAASRLVVEALAAALFAMDASARGAHALLELLREELLRSGVATPPALLPWLGQFSGSSRAAKAAQALRSGT